MKSRDAMSSSVRTARVQTRGISASSRSGGVEQQVEHNNHITSVFTVYRSFSKMHIVIKFIIFYNVMIKIKLIFFS